MNKTIIMILSAAVLFVFTGCTEPFIKPENPIFYPPAPSQPRIMYERSIRGAIDFRQISIIDKLLGIHADQDIEKPLDVYAQGDKVYISDTGNKVVHVIDLKEKKTSLLGQKGGAGFRLPMGIAGLPDGTVFVVDQLHRKVLVFSAAGIQTSVIGPGNFKAPSGIAVNSELGRLYITDVRDHNVKVYSTKGEFLFQFGAGGEGDGLFLSPSFIAVDRRTGEVYVSDTNNFRAQVFDKDGKFVRKFGELGDAPGYFSRPKGIGVDSEGQSYVADGTFNCFQIFNEKGKVLAFVGVGGWGAGGLFMSPSGLYIDENDKIYVVDVLNKRVQVFQYMNEKWKKEHPEEYTKYLTNQTK